MVANINLPGRGGEPQESPGGQWSDSQQCFPKRELRNTFVDKHSWGTQILWLSPWDIHGGCECPEGLGRLQEEMLLFPPILSAAQCFGKGIKRAFIPEPLRGSCKKGVPGVDVVTQQVRPPLGTPASPIREPVQVLATLLPIQPPLTVPGKQQMMVEFFLPMIRMGEYN